MITRSYDFLGGASFFPPTMPCFSAVFWYKDCPGTLVSRINPKSLQSLGIPFVAGKHELFPIPNVQIDLSDGILQQNPGW